MLRYSPLPLLIILTFSTFNCYGQNAGNNKITAFTNVSLIPMYSARVLENQTVLIEGNIIAEFGPAEKIKIPEAASVIKSDGRFLMPGLTDFHIHLRSTDELISYLAHGITTVVHMSGATGEAPDLLRYRKQLANNTMTGPQLFTTGPIIDGDPPVFSGVSIGVSDPEEARRAVARQKRAGYDFIKIYNNLTPDLLVAVTEEAEEQGIAVIGHIPRKGGRDEALQRALEAGIDMIAHGEEYFFTYFYNEVDSLMVQGLVPYPDEKRIPEVVEMTKKAGVAVTPNLSFVAMTRKQLDSLDVVLSNSETKYLAPEVLEMWKEQNPTNRSDPELFDRRERAKFLFLKKLTKALEDAGVPLLLGTDSSAPGMFPGTSAHTELYELVEAGLTPYEALATGTVNAGKFIVRHISSANPFGIIEAGYSADLILLENNPIENITHISSILGVMKKGRWYPKEKLERMREGIKNSRRQH